MARDRSLSAQAWMLLEFLAEAPEEWGYGYDIVRFSGLRSGTLYPLLVRLKANGDLKRKLTLEAKGLGIDEALRDQALHAAQARIAQLEGQQQSGGGADRAGAVRRGPPALVVRHAGRRCRTGMSLCARATRPKNR